MNTVKMTPNEIMLYLPIRALLRGAFFYSGWDPQLENIQRLREVGTLRSK